MGAHARLPIATCDVVVQFFQGVSYEYTLLSLCIYYMCTVWENNSKFVEFDIIDILDVLHVPDILDTLDLLDILDKHHLFQSHPSKSRRSITRGFRSHGHKNLNRYVISRN